MSESNWALGRQMRIRRYSPVGWLMIFSSPQPKSRSLSRTGLAFDDDQRRFFGRLHQGFLHKVLAGISRLDAVRGNAAVGQGNDPALVNPS